MSAQGAESSSRSPELPSSPRFHSIVVLLIPRVSGEFIHLEPWQVTPKFPHPLVWEYPPWRASALGSSWFSFPQEPFQTCWSGIQRRTVPHPAAQGWGNRNGNEWFASPSAFSGTFMVYSQCPLNQSCVCHVQWKILSHSPV